MRLKNNLAVLSVMLAAIVLAAPSIAAQKIDEATRIKNRDQLARMLSAAAEATHMNFQRSKTNQFNYSAYLTTGLKQSDTIEVVIGATDVHTIFMRAFPKYKGNYINVDKVREPLTLMRQMLKLSGRTFCHWGTDAQGDVFFGFTFTLESGFPTEAIRVVLRSIAHHDEYIAELKSAIE